MIGEFEIVKNGHLLVAENCPYLVAHFYYGQGVYSQWKYDPKTGVYEHRMASMGDEYEVNHRCTSWDETCYTMMTCLKSCCCPNDDIKSQRIVSFLQNANNVKN